MTQGIACPDCGAVVSHVIYMRPRIGRLVRRRICLRCNFRFNTVEKIPVKTSNVPLVDTSPVSAGLQTPPQC